VNYKYSDTWHLFIHLATAIYIFNIPITIYKNIPITMYKYSHVHHYGPIPTIHYASCFASNALSKMAENLAAACQKAAEALNSLQNITSEDLSRMASSTSTSTSPSGPSICSELSARFPSYRPSSSSSGNANAHANCLQRPVVSQSSRKRRRKAASGDSGKRGRPCSASIVHRELVIIPHPDTKKVPTHAACVALEKNKLVVSGFPFDRSWDAVALKSNIRKQLPGEYMLFQYVKASKL
jgi:hypothetical protein